MANARAFFVSIAGVFVLGFFALHAWANDNIAVVQYELKPVESVDSGRYIKTEWNAKIRNKTSQPVKFLVTIIFVDSDNETLKEVASQCELSAHQTKTFKDTALIETSIASRTASTRVTVEETTEGEAPPDAL